MSRWRRRVPPDSRRTSPAQRSRREIYFAQIDIVFSLSSDTTASLPFGAVALQVRQHAHAAVDVPRGYGDDFLADAMKFQIDAHFAYGQIADAQRLDANG